MKQKQYIDMEMRPVKWKTIRLHFVILNFECRKKTKQNRANTVRVMRPTWDRAFVRNFEEYHNGKLDDPRYKIDN